jgi:P27 family predicted phage terminase small subunit
MRGRKPKPTHLKILDGTVKEFPKSEPLPIGELDLAPDWMSEEQKSSWEYAIAHAPEGLLKKLDRSILAAWVIAEDLHRQATMEVNEHGLVTKSPVKGDPMQNPYLSIANRQAQIMMKAGSELGFTPSSRSRVSISDKQQDDHNPFAEFKRG